MLTVLNYTPCKYVLRTYYAELDVVDCEVFDALMQFHWGIHRIHITNQHVSKATRAQSFSS